MEFLERLEEELERAISSKQQNYPERTLVDAMLYSALSGGKRLRARLVNAFALGKDSLKLAAAIEMVHCYSLIHDDLPSMDNDDYRRGKLTLHKKYDEATAILAGDALLTLAFEEITESDLSDSDKILCVKIISKLAGAYGMVGGQMADIYFEGKAPTEEELRRLQREKTGCLIMASCMLGAVAAGYSNLISVASEFGESVGLAFQIEDDILDITGTLEELGKDPNSDLKNEKTTFVSPLGVEKSREIIENETAKAINALKGTPFDVEDVKEIALTLKNRKN